jgi:hypothetical protein
VTRRGGSKRGLLAIVPFFIAAAANIAITPRTHLFAPGYHDTRFSFSAPRALLILNSLGRLLFGGGLIALAVILWNRDRSDWRKIAFTFFRMTIALGPYCFLTYTMQVPSRHSHVASA